MQHPQWVSTSTALQRAVTRENVALLWSGENFLASFPSSHSSADYEVSHRVLERPLLGVWDYSPCQPFNVQSLGCVKCCCVCVALHPLVSVSEGGVAAVIRKISASRLFTEDLPAARGTAESNGV